MYIFRKIINDLILNNQFKKLIEFPLDSEGYQIVKMLIFGMFLAIKGD